MGGPGSGRFPSIMPPTLDNLPKFSIDQVTRLSKLKPGWTGGIDLYPAGSVFVQVAEESITVSYSVSPNAVLSYTLPLERSPCRYGGQRGAVRCLGCGNHSLGCNHACRVLYISSQGPQCRRRIGLPYRSQQNDRLANLYLKLNKLRYALGCAPGAGPLLPSRPVRMHRRVYEAMAKEICNLSAQITAVHHANEARFIAILGGAKHEQPK